MFGWKKGPDRPFQHAEDCKIVHADPGVEIPWSEIRRGVWEASCVCGVQYHHDPVADSRVRLSPFDPKTGRHSALCEFATPAAVRHLVDSPDVTGTVRVGSSRSWIDGFALEVVSRF